MVRSRASLAGPSRTPPLTTTVQKSLSTTQVRRRNTLYRVARNERQFLFLLGIAFFAAGASFPYPEVARWVGFTLAAYSAIANDSMYGLSGGVQGGDVERAKAVARQIRTGQIEVNQGAFNPNAPFGGYKQSGYGREYGTHGFEEFLETKSMQL